MEQSQLFKEIDLIQNCIERMNRNSFMIKGWSLTLFTVIVTFLRNDIINNVFLLAICVILPYICFWLLDSFFLHTEIKYRKMYEWVLKKRKQDIFDFQYDLNPARFNKNVCCVFKTIFSHTLLLFYGLPIITVILVYILLHFKIIN